jgi:hypothetical protein
MVKKLKPHENKIHWKAIPEFHYVKYSCGKKTVTTYSLRTRSGYRFMGMNEPQVACGDIHWKIRTDNIKEVNCQRCRAMIDSPPVSSRSRMRMPRPE